MVETMHAMVLEGRGRPLRSITRPIPQPARNEVLVEVSACGVCRTDLHIVDGDLRGKLPIIPGHEVVGRVAALGAEVTGFGLRERVGVPWLGGTCQTCSYCREGRENLCDAPQFTGFTRDGGFASHCVADARYCFPVPERFGDVEATPLLCAGLIGYRSYKMIGPAERIGFYGFGAAAHILAQLAIWQGRTVFAFTRTGDTIAMEFARRLGCAWAGPAGETSPDELDAAIIFAPAGWLVPEALKRVRKGGKVVCAGIHMSDIPGFPYADLWGEREILSVANLTRTDGREFLTLVAEAPLQTSTTRFALTEANQALERLRAGNLEGAAVLVPSAH
jgi:alcohol dehydrogenase, propanol-preferring